MNYEEEYQEDANQYIQIIERYSHINETDMMNAYKLMIDSNIARERWSKIRHDIRKISMRNQNAEIKDRIKDMCDILEEINTECRMIWSRAKSDLKEGRF